MSGGLFGSAILDVAIGLAFVYLVLALLCTTVNEWIAGISKRRAVLLKKGISQLLSGQTHGDSNFLDAFYKHPVIEGLTRDGKHPSYLPARTFTAAVLDLVAEHPANATPGDLASGVKSLPAGRIKTALAALARTGGREAADLEPQLEGWFEDAMDRVSGWYKRETQMWTVAVAVILTLAINADTTKIVRHLWTDPALRAAVVARASERAAAQPPSMRVEYKDPDDPMNPTVTRLDPNRVYAQDRELLGQLVGWGPEEQGGSLGDWLLRICGWLLTAVALSLGAPFWFDVLNKFINIRSAGKSPDEVAKKPEKKKLPPADKAA
jgi:hypothetical protein